MKNMHYFLTGKQMLFAFMLLTGATSLCTQVYNVTTTADSGTGSFRDAINQVNAGTYSTIDFALTPSSGNYNSSSDTWTIQPQTDLPIITQPVTINGYSQKGFSKPNATPNTLTVGDNAILKVIINGSNYTICNGYCYGNGLHFGAGSDGSVVTGLVINQWISNGILIDGVFAPAPIPNPCSSINVCSNLVPQATQINGIKIVGCFIGTDYTGTQVIANRTGIGIAGTEFSYPATPNGTIIGTPNIADRNIIAGSFGYFIKDYYGLRGACICSSNSGGTTIQNNYIGLDVTGSKALGTSQCGVMILGDVSDLIGGTDSLQGNVISGHDIYGINFTGLQPYNFAWTSGLPNNVCNVVQGNYIGTNVKGTQPLGNANAGIELDSWTVGTQIGGSQPGAANVISGNGTGIRLGQLDMPGSETNVIQGNLIGTDPTGNRPLGNTGWGIILNDNYNIIGGTQPGQANVISANSLGGILIHNAFNNEIVGNTLGTNSAGTRPLANGGPNIQCLATPAQCQNPNFNVIG